MSKFNSDKFVEAFQKKVTKQAVCPICGCDKFMTNGNNYAQVLTGDDLDNISLKTYIPAGTLICQNCGHIELFALPIILDEE